MQKTCLEHGSFEIKIAKYSWYYKGLNDYYNVLHNHKSLEMRNPNRPIYTSDITSRCNLKCPICITNSTEVGRDLSIDFFEKKLMEIKNKKIILNLSGGEPTLREDLPEIINLISKSGNKACLLTNGLRIAEDFNYLKKLKKNGLKSVNLWIDTLKNQEIYKKMRGKDFIEIKERVLKNTKALKIPTTILLVLLRGINESEIGSMLKFIKKDNFLSTLWVRGYNYLGRRFFSSDQEFLTDELIEIIAEQSNNMFDLEDFYYWQKILITLSAISKNNSSWCYGAPHIFLPRNKQKSLKDTFKFEKFAKILDSFENIWHIDKQKAKRFFLLNLLPLFCRNLPLALSLRKLKGFGYNSYISKDYFLLLINCTDKSSALDIERIQRQCMNFNFNSGPKKNVSRCYELFNLYNQTIDQNNNHTDSVLLNI